MRDDAPREARRSPGKRAAIALAVAVHLALAVFLIYGVAWQTKPTDVVEVDLVANAPAAAPAKAETPPPPAPVAKPEPKPEPRVEPKPAPTPPKPDIVVKEKPKPPKEEPKPKFDPLAWMRNALSHEDKQAAERKAADEQAKAKAAQDAAQAAAARGKAVAGYVDRIRSKIRGNIVLPPDLQGNPVAKFRVVQLPSGEIVGDPRLVKSSGNGAYDAAVDRAIRKSSPLPKPDDPSLFSRELDLTFCPQESGCN